MKWCWRFDRRKRVVQNIGKETRGRFHGGRGGRALSIGIAGSKKVIRVVPVIEHNVDGLNVTWRQCDHTGGDQHEALSENPEATFGGLWQYAAPQIFPPHGFVSATPRSFAGKA